jgi:16S rRNA (cytosine967-C5)-methyltransferase
VAAEDRLRQVPWSALKGVGSICVRAIERTLGGEPAEVTVDRMLRRHRSFSAEQRRVAAESVFGVALWRRRLAYQLGVRDWTDAAPELLLFSLLRDLGGVPSDAAAGFSGLPQSLQLPVQRAAPENLADRYSLPDWIEAAIHREFGDEAGAFCDSIDQPGPICLRANRLRVDREGLGKVLETEGVAVKLCPHAPCGVIVDSAVKPNILGLRSHQEGLFEVQDEGSQLVGALVGAKPGEAVLDYCAGVGGKTLLLAGDMQNHGTLYVHDIDAKRLDRLFVRAGRAGVECLRRLEATSTGLQVDAVLVDAPCSELGVLRRGPDVRFRVSEQAMALFPAIQLEILDSAQRHVRPGGRLVYATCTFLHPENQAVAEAFSKAHPDFRRVTPGEGWLDSSFRRDGYFVSAPHRQGTDSFFAAIWRRNG